MDHVGICVFVDNQCDLCMSAIYFQCLAKDVIIIIGRNIYIVLIFYNTRAVTSFEPSFFGVISHSNYSNNYLHILCQKLAWLVTLFRFDVILISLYPHLSVILLNYDG